MNLVSIGSLLDRLDARASTGDRTCAEAALVIRKLEVDLSCLESEIVEAEFSRYAHAAELESLRQRAINALKQNARGSRK